MRLEQRVPQRIFDGGTARFGGRRAEGTAAQLRRIGRRSAELLACVGQKGEMAFLTTPSTSAPKYVFSLSNLTSALRPPPPRPPRRPPLPTIGALLVLAPNTKALLRPHAAKGHVFIGPARRTGGIYRFQ